MPNFERATVKAIRIYPAKSTAELDGLDQAWVDLDGLRTVDGQAADHEVVFVRKNRQPHETHHPFITQRPEKKYKSPDRLAFPELARIKPSIQDGPLTLSWDGKDPVEVRRNIDPKRVVPVRIYDWQGEGLEIPELSRRASEWLDYEVFAVHASGPWQRTAREKYFPNENPLRAQDGAPVHPVLYEDVLALTDELLRLPVEELIRRGVDPENPMVPWNRFRPQLLFEGAPAWSLHEVYSFRVEEVDMIQGWPCGRCPMTGIDQLTGENSLLKPLALLKNIRPMWVDPDGERKQIIGENALPQNTGLIRVGSPVVATAYRKDSQVLTYSS